MSKRSEDVTAALLFVAVFAGGVAIGRFGWLGVLLAGVAAVAYVLKQRYVGQMISGKAMDNEKVPIGTVVVWEPPNGRIGAPSFLTVNGWVRQDGTHAGGHLGAYRSTRKDWRILHVGNGKPTI